MQQQQYQFGRLPQQQRPSTSQSNVETMQAQRMGQHGEVAVKHPPSSMLARNRRHSKLKLLWKQGYFEEESIMLRFPTLYFEYVGQFKKDGKQGFTSISQFLESQIISTQYRRLLGQEQQKNNMHRDSSKKEQNFQESQMQEQTEGPVGEPQVSPYEQKLLELKPIDLQMQQQSLIDELQLQFLEGNLPGFDYGQIDEDQQLDNRALMDEDEEENYFAGEADQERDPTSNTGVQDF